jgi:hypothetical protein
VPTASLLFLVSAAAAWVLTGQHVSGLAAWLQTSAETSSAYSEAMSTPVGPYQRRELALFAVNVAALMGLEVWRACRASQPRRAAAAVTISLAMIVFVAFKLGFVRHDAHATVAMFLMPVLGVVVATGDIAPAHRRRFARLAGVVVLIGFTSYAYGLRRYYDRLAPPEHYRAAYAFQLSAMARYLVASRSGAQTRIGTGGTARGPAPARWRRIDGPLWPHAGAAAGARRDVHAASSLSELRRLHRGSCPHEQAGSPG